uniref:Uncharacterized protein n=1 Tax=viral metagenome TaxID=1070528 RepID=A0A6H1ZZ64_9ZZZZ
MGEAYWYYAQRKNAPSTAATGEVTYDLPETGFIPTILLTCFSTPTSSASPALPLVDAITEVTIKDAGKEIISLNANQIMGIFMHRGSRSYVSTETNDNAVEQHQTFPILLGEVVNGVKYAPDFSKFTNPQITIKWDYSITTTNFGMICEADIAPVMKFTIACMVQPADAGYTHGYMRSRQIKTWSQTTSTETKIDIPSGEKLYGIMIEAGYDALNWTEDIEQLKLSLQSGKWIPLDLQEEELRTLDGDIWGAAEISYCADVADAEEYDVHMGYVDDVNFAPLEKIDDLTFWFVNAHRGIETLNVDTSGQAAYTTHFQTAIHVKGFMPYQCLYIPSWYLTGKTDDLIDTEAAKTAVLYCTSGAAASTSSKPAIVIETFVIG